MLKIKATPYLGERLACPWPSIGIAEPTDEARR